MEPDESDFMICAHDLHKRGLVSEDLVLELSALESTLAEDEVSMHRVASFPLPH